MEGGEGVGGTSWGAMACDELRWDGMNGMGWDAKIILESEHDSRQAGASVQVYVFGSTHSKSHSRVELLHAHPT